MTGLYVESFSDDDPMPGYDAHDWDNHAADDYIHDRLAHEADDTRKQTKEGSR